MIEVDLVLAPNPGPFTGPGTNSYVISSEGAAVVLDPGPVIADHVAAIETALRANTPLAVLVTHTHPDHAPAANLLGERLGAPVLGFAPGPEFEPTHQLSDGDMVEVGSAALVAVHTPGHTADHLCYRVGDVLFTGDHIMGGSTVILEDASAYLRSLRKVESLAPRHLYPGHGPEIPEASQTITDYIRHRLEREREIVAAVGSGASTPLEIVQAVYADIDPDLQMAAARQVEVQLTKLAEEGRVLVKPDESGVHRIQMP
jgi:glyoxylase-like metal-dependent hydrolase (beta-lactamase superfamily II)